MPDLADLCPEDREALLAHFSPEHSDFVRLAHRIGRRALEIVLEELGGMNTYVPKVENFYSKLWLEWRDECIRRADRGNNQAELASTWGISERQVREILKRK